MSRGRSGRRRAGATPHVNKGPVCALCGAPAQRSVEIYVDSEQRDLPICDGCIAQAYLATRSNLVFCAAMQLLWLLPVACGPSSAPGVAGIVGALFFLVRLGLLLAARHELRGVTAYEGEVSQVPDWIWRFAQGEAYVQEYTRDEMGRRGGHAAETVFEHDREARERDRAARRAYQAERAAEKKAEARQARRSQRRKDT
ncbi:hypothetical protein H6A18_08365 [Collinsella tanakaei]|uniref:hypothetical protein n=1 Tax=Collinsella tanakaei TaxID=626935 RepID=UPI00195B899B|nr:hypothetical protein [Collinsella tanakaei]MBM6756521.1 hypothetical protein [Collinsella tanakaei]